MPRSQLARLRRKGVQNRPVPVGVRRYVKRMITAAKQDIDSYVDVAFENAAYDTESINQITSFTAIIAGSKKRLKKLECRYQLKATAAAGGTWVRVIFFQWFGDNNVDVPTLENIVRSTADQYSVIDAYNDDSDNLYKVLQDRTHLLGENTGLDGRDIAIGKFNMYSSRFPHKYVEGTASDKGMNNVYCLAFSNIANASTPPQIALTAKTLYSDYDIN